MRRLGLCAFLVLSADPAFAEVCDKVRPDWHSSDGPVSQLQELYIFFSNPLGLLLISLCFLALLVKRTWVCTLVMLLLVAVAGLIAAHWFWPIDGITREANLEGCIAPPFITSLVMLVLAIVVGTFGRKRQL